MEIKRIDSYTDCRFSEVALQQHGCFLVDNVPYEVEILSNEEALVRGADNRIFTEVIDAFRFYAPHISRFYDENHAIVKEFMPRQIFKVDLAQIQPSQFYVDEDKIAAVRHFIHKPEDIVIQVLPYQNRYISLDGHTRLYYAVMQGWDSVYAVEEVSDAGVYPFVQEAMHRQIYTPMDLSLVSHREYDEKWNDFCDALFAESDSESNAH